MKTDMNAVDIVLMLIQKLQEGWTVHLSFNATAPKEKQEPEPEKQTQLCNDCGGAMNPGEVICGLCGGSPCSDSGC